MIALIMGIGFEVLVFEYKDLELLNALIGA